MPADRGRYPPPAVALPSPPAGSRVAAPPGAPFAGDHATGSPLTQCPPARLWLNARRPASDSMPAGSPLTQARRIAADSSPPDRRWLKPAGLVLTHARRPPLSLAPWIKSTCHGQECRVSVLLCPQEHFKLTLSCPWRLVWGRRLLLWWPRRPFQPPAPLSPKWKRLLRDPVRAPDSSSCPEEASASKPAQEGFLFL